MAGMAFVLPAIHGWDIRYRGMRARAPALRKRRHPGGPGCRLEASAPKREAGDAVAPARYNEAMDSRGIIKRVLPIALLFCIASLLAACPQGQKTSTTAAPPQRPPVLRGGWWAPAGNAQRTRRGSAEGPGEDVTEQWSLPVPIPAVLDEHSFFEECPAVIVDDSGTCYCLALAIPAVAEELELEQKLLDDRSREMSMKESMSLGAASMSHDLYADIAPKQAFL